MHAPVLFFKTQSIDSQSALILSMKTQLKQTLYMLPSQTALSTNLSSLYTYMYMESEHKLCWGQLVVCEYIYYCICKLKRTVKYLLPLSLVCFSPNLNSSP